MDRHEFVLRFHQPVAQFQVIAATARLSRTDDGVASNWDGGANPSPRVSRGGGSRSVMEPAAGQPPSGTALYEEWDCRDRRPRRLVLSTIWFVAERSHDAAAQNLHASRIPGNDRLTDLQRRVGAIGNDPVALLTDMDRVIIRAASATDVVATGIPPTALHLFVGGTVTAALMITRSMSVNNATGIVANGANATLKIGQSSFPGMRLA